MATDHAVHDQAHARTPNSTPPGIELHPAGRQIDTTATPLHIRLNPPKGRIQRTWLKPLVLGRSSLVAERSNGAFC